jgi:hypothetical protein
MNDVLNHDTPKLHSLFLLIRLQSHRRHFSALFGSRWIAGQSGGLAGCAVGIEEGHPSPSRRVLHGAQFLAIHLFRCTGVGVPYQMCDVLNRNPCAREQRDETVSQLSRCPFLRVEPGVLGYLAEGTPNIGCVERGYGI